MADPLLDGSVKCMLLELGYSDGRCGVRDQQGAIALAHAISTSEHLRLTGIEA